MKPIYYFESNENTLRIIFYTEKIIHMTFGKNLDEKKSSMIITTDVESLPEVKIAASKTESEFIVATDALKVIVDKSSLAVCFERTGRQMFCSCQ